MIGGLTSDRAIKLVRGLKDLNIVGMDVVEVAPAYDQSEITALAAATLALEMLYIGRRKRRVTVSGYFTRHFEPGQCSPSSRTTCTLRWLCAVRSQTGFANNARSLD